MTINLTQLNNIDTHIKILKDIPPILYINIDCDESFSLDYANENLKNKLNEIIFYGDYDNTKLKAIAPLLNKEDYINFEYVLKRNLNVSRLERG